MYRKKLLIAGCVLMSMGMLYGGSPSTGTAYASVQTTTFAKPTTTKTKTVPMVSLSKNIKGVKSETKSNAALEKLIIDHYDIPDEYLDLTTYYYNYVDLNADGKKKIFVIVSGPYTSGTGGDSALWVSQSGKKLSVKQEFTLMNTPVIISNHKTNGVHDLVVPYYGKENQKQYKVLTSGQKGYTRVSDSKTVKSLTNIKGKAIIANDILKEVNNGKSGIKLHSSKETTDTTEVDMVVLPAGIKGMKASTTANASLEKLIAKEYDIPDDFLNQTTYYYNNVDLNDDGKDEIFVMINGLYTSGSGGNSALLVSESNGVLHIDQRFTLINGPVIISDNKTNGVHDLIVPNYGGGAKSQYKVLTSNGTSYTTVNDAKSIDTLDGVKGKAIIANDIVKEIANGQSGLTLQKR